MNYIGQNRNNQMLESQILQVETFLEEVFQLSAKEFQGKEELNQVIIEEKVEGNQIVEEEKQIEEDIEIIIENLPKEEEKVEVVEPQKAT